MLVPMYLVIFISHPLLPSMHKCTKTKQRLKNGDPGRNLNKLEKVLSPIL